MDSTPNKGMVDVGQGTIDFAKIFAQREQAGIEYLFVEHDEPKSPFETIKRSYDYLHSLRF
jgi:sugar phosphate isomerase/epimerase